jgi:sulfide:quinone oxidoreductase
MARRTANGTVPSMLPTTRRDPHRIVIAGGGIAALEALVALREQASSGCRITLASPTGTFAYRPLAVQEPFGRGGGRRFSLAALTRDLGAAYVRDALVRVDGPARTAILRTGASLQYDTLLIATGAHPYPAFAHGVTFDRDTEAAEFDELLSDIDARLAPHVAIVVPEHVGWTLPAYELALSIAAYGRRPRGRRLAVTLVTHERQPLAAFGTTASRAVADVLDEAGVEVIAGREGVVMSDGALIAGSQWITADRIVALPRLAGPRPRGVPSDPHGFIPVDCHGRVPDLPGVYAAGDGTSASIKQGGLAAQQADAVVAHIVWQLGAAAEPTPPTPVLRGVLRTPRGTLYLQAELGPGRAGEGSTASWLPLWPAPGRVASRRLGRYLSSSSAPASPASSSGSCATR